MKTKIGGGEIAPHLFELSHKRFLSALPKSFKKVLLPGLSDEEIDAELTKLYIENGGTIIQEEIREVIAGASDTGGGDSKPTTGGNSKTKPRATRNRSKV